MYVYDPATTAWYPSCPFRALTGLLCPLCGSLRAAHALVHGRIVDAFLLNPFVLVSGIALVITPELKFGPTSVADTGHRRNVGPSFPPPLVENQASYGGRAVALAKAGSSPFDRLRATLSEVEGSGAVSVWIGAALVFTVLRNLP